MNSNIDSMGFKSQIRYQVSADYENYQRVIHELAVIEVAFMEPDAESYPELSELEDKRNELIRMFDNTPSFVVDDFESVAPLLRYCDNTDHVITDNLIHVMRRWSNDLRLMNYLELNKGRKIAFLNDRHFPV